MTACPSATQPGHKKKAGDEIRRTFHAAKVIAASTPSRESPEKPHASGATETLAQRLGQPAWERRIERENSRLARFAHRGQGLFRWTKLLPTETLVRWGLRLAGLERQTRRNCLTPQVREEHWHIPRLPRAFENFRLLQLTDLHLDIDPDLARVIAEGVRHTSHDAAVVTGDFRDKPSQEAYHCLALLPCILDELAPWRVAVLGNHDSIEMVPHLESMGLPVLLNEAVAWERDGQVLWIAGVDDPHFYQTHDFARARARVPPEACCLLLCHSPEVGDEAAAHGFALMLSGHTHGGQLCLPGGHPVVCPVPRAMPRERVRGRWQAGTMPGYTSPGTGSCGVPARLNCPAEITVHILHKPT